MENATDEKELAELMLNIIENPESENKLIKIAQKLEERYKKENCGKHIVSRKNLTQKVL